MRTTAASEGEGKAGCWAALAPGGALRGAREAACPPRPVPALLRQRIAPAQVGVSPTTRDVSAKLRPPLPGCTVSLPCSPLCTAPGTSSLWGRHPFAHHLPLRAPPKPADEQAPCQAH